MPEPKGPASKDVVGEEIGCVVGFFAIPSAAIVEIKKGTLKVGDTIWIRGNTTDLKQTIQSMQIDRAPITQANAGAHVGIQVESRVRRHDLVYKI